jgi:leucyl-tRNA synthetase
MAFRTWWITVVRKKMTVEHAISAYAERLLQGLNDIDWSESIKESQRNWLISWCDCKFNVQNSDSKIAILQDP